MSESEATPGAPAVSNLEPAQGPAGTVVTLNGSGFQSGDTVQITGGSFGTATLATVSVTASALVATLPVSPVSAPQDIKVRVVRGAESRPAAGLAFKVTPGRVRYVSPDGNDSADGTITRPLRTINAAVGKMAPGDLTYLRAGTYRGQVAIRASGTASAPITLAGYPGESPLITIPSTSSSALDTLRVYGGYVVLDRLRVTNDNNPGQAIWIAFDGHHVTISNSEIFGSKGQGILISGGNNTIIKNRIHDNGTHAPFDHGIYVEGPNNVIRWNLVYNNFAYGIHVYNGRSGSATGGHVIEHNYVFHNGYGSTAAAPSKPTSGIILAAGGHSSTVRYNRVCDNAQVGILLIDGMRNNTISGNVTCYNRQGGIDMRYPGSGNKLTGNVSYNDQRFALASNRGVTSDDNVFYSQRERLNLRFGGRDYTLGGYQSASGQDGRSRSIDPELKSVPQSAFDASAATSYDFCTPVIPALCSAAP